MKLFDYLIQEANWIPLQTNLQEISDIVLEEAGFQWIPVSERLPESTDVFIVTFLWDKIKEVTVTTSSFFKHNGWAVEKDNTGFNRGKVLAWMPKPKPYDPQP